MTVKTDKSEVQSTWDGVVADWSADKETFAMPWGKLMMWIFLLGDTFIFGVFLIGYMAARMAAVEPWPDTEAIFTMTMFGHEFPLLLIAIMTFILITSSGTMAMAVNYGYRGDKRKAVMFMGLTALFGATFLGMQVFEWYQLIVHYDIRPWGNPHGASQFGAVFFMITGFHGMHVLGGVILLIVMARRVHRGLYDKKGYAVVEITGLYWHFVDLVWVFIFAFFYLL
ncbi:MAG: cytochrome c oxidase subunit 3 [Natronospirillum sp.]|uniref:cytochrome c oxidase subunit 3 n=1 Tax=Natronospirillum sp. TaxID=2812955 RepID=UPI0025F21BD1|nr:cytochrome c oxidase subunit 3 [Natronospirillum sp.]MCH8552778.1 cytochrome c oxidase subunit 3 [Natronospirillum sp.]